MRLEVDRLRHRHPGAGRDTPSELSFALSPGERVLLLGPNGAGKTSLLLRLVGLLDGPGTVLLGGEVMAGARRHRLRRGIGLVWQSPDDALLLPTVIEDVALGPANDGRPVAEAAAVAREWLERFGITHLADRQVRGLSLGEKQMVSVAGVLAREPGLLLLDEPSASLDEAHRRRLNQVLGELSATILLATHDQSWREVPGFHRCLTLA
jgi:cobalt/nickel transport system ATP-binding protein